MKKRLITGAGLIIYAFGLLIGGFYEPICIDILILSFMFVGVYEILNSLKKGGYKPYIWITWLYSIAVFPMIYYFGLKGYLVAFACALLVTMITFVFILTGDKQVDYSNFLATLLSLIYPTGIISLILIMTSKITPIYVCAMVIMIAITTDQFAYLFGKTFKGKKLCPKISPKKTISGAIGGLIGGIIGSIVVYLICDYSGWMVNLLDIPTLHPTVGGSVGIYIALGLVGSFVSQIGDLFASKLKRVLNIKDFGNIFPGHGGALDRLDSISFNIIFLFIVFNCIGLL